MNCELKPLNGNLLTANCWWRFFVCLLFVFPFGAFAQSADSLSIAKQDTLSSKVDSLSVDSAALGDDLKSEVKYNAEDSIVYDIEGEKIYLYGKAEINYEEINLKANYIELDNGNHTVLAHGMPDSTGKMAGLPVFKQASEEFKSENILYNFNTKKGKITEVTTKDGDSYVRGSIIKKEPDNTTYIRNGYYTTCELEHPHYYIYSNKIKVIPNNKIVTGPADMFVADVPTPLALPFGFFPNKKGRSSGILFPSYGESNQLGFFLQNGGYYIGLSDYFDLALTGDIYSKGSWRGNAYSTYANRYHYRGDLSLNYSYTKTSIPELPDYAIEKGFFVRWLHTQDAKSRPNSNFTANVNAGSSSFYRNNLTTANNYLTNTFNSSIAYSKTWAGKPYSFSSSFSHTQNTTTRDISLSLPSANFSVSRLTPFKRKSAVGEVKWYEKIGVSYNNTVLNTISTKDSLLFRDESLDQFRYGMQHSIPVSTSFNVLKFFTLSPSISYNEKWYLKTIEKRYNQENDSLITDTVSGFKAARDFAFSTSLSTRIYGMVQFKRGKIAAVRHVITPTLSFSWRPDFSEEKWHAYKNVQVDSSGTVQRYSIYETGIFSGPGAGKSSLLNFSIDNNLEMKTRHQTDTAVVMKKYKILESLSLGGSYNFAADSLRFSYLSIAARTTLFEKLSLNFSSVFDPYIINEQGIRVNQTEWDVNKKIARFTNANFSADLSLTQNKSYQSEKGSPEELEDINKNKADYLDYTVPFNFALHYNFNFQDNVLTPDQTTQTLGFNGDIQLTPAWKITFSSGYDFVQKDLSYTSLGIFRDLHCWEMRLNWVPFGFQQNYYFQINVKSSVLQDLKLSKKNDRFDRR